MSAMSLTVTPAHAAASVAEARDSTRTFLQRLLRPIPSETADSVILVVSELVTNALRHGGGTFTLDLNAHPADIEVAVHDRSPQSPRMRAPDVDGATGGFGWPMVNRLARTTAVTRRPSGGKTLTTLIAR
ncbi:ATP-binding protein [Streptomyces sp. NPDC102402]|uniref:ATP-binding protein n=1 Tax=Streptomyces sp. NPDC102402 TaxID=3366169 RepID=UPI003823ECEA